MLATLQMWSFHAGLFWFASILFYILLGFIWPFHFGGRAMLSTVWFLCSVVTVVLISRGVRAYRVEHWVRSEAHGASLLLVIGHLAPVAGAFIYLKMLNAGSGSGIVFLPLIGWACIFYPIGLIGAIGHLSAINSDFSKPSSASSF